MCRWPPALLSTTRAGVSPAARGMETAADFPTANTVSNRAIAAFSLVPCWVVAAWTVTTPAMAALRSLEKSSCHYLAIPGLCPFGVVEAVGMDALSQLKCRLRVG